MTREEILNEIRRTSDENGGKPLGRGRFVQVTGITEYEVLGHWPNWSAAVQEAGLEPNTLNLAYDEGFLIEKFIGLVRKLGRVPTNPEIRLERAKSDPQFPSSNTFERLGRKNDRIGRALDYSRERPGNEDVIAILESAYVTPTGTDDREATSDENTQSGFVYCARGRSGEYKIGRTGGSSDVRLAALDTGSSVRLALIHEIKTDDPVGVEDYWHKRFDSKRIDPRKEWFRLTAGDVRAFKRWRRIY